MKYSMVEAVGGGTSADGGVLQNLGCIVMCCCSRIRKKKVQGATIDFVMVVLEWDMVPPYGLLLGFGFVGVIVGRMGLPRVV